MLATALALAGACARTVARVLVPLAPYLAAAAVGGAAAEAYERRAPWGLSARLGDMTTSRNDWRSAQEDTAKVSAAWKRQAEDQAGLRQRESDTARRAVSELQAQCADRVARAKASSRALQAIIQKELPTDAKGCPVRGLVDPGELQHAIAARP